MYSCIYHTPDGYDDMIMNSDGEYLTALCFEHSMDIAKLASGCEEKDLPIFYETRRWLDMYFRGEKPDFTPKYKIVRLTPFREQVVELMKKIPYGETVTYGDIARELAKKRGLDKMSAQAVGGAVGFNPICIIVPCHRVVGTNGSLTGYGGGIKNKVKLLEHEGNDMTRLTIPQRGTAL